VIIELDDAKNASNLAKHGVLLEAGLVILADKIGERVDKRRDYGEERTNAFGLIAGRLFVCTYTMRGNARRIISVRRASKKEQREWQS